MTTIHDLRVEHHRDALGIGEAEPRLSWSLADTQGAAQTRYQISVSDEISGLRADADPVDSSESVLVPWQAVPLRSRERRQVRVRVWVAGESEPSEWSEPIVVEAGLLHRSDWNTDFVSPSVSHSAEGPRPAYRLRSRFDLPAGDVARVRIYATAHGVYELHLNASAVSSDILAPGWTSYLHRLRYQTYDITGLVVPGQNTISALIADGWYRGRLGFNGGLWDNYGTDVALLAQIEATMSDGTVHVLPVSSAWECAPSAIISTGLYEGEEHDASLDDLVEEWTPASVLPFADFTAEIVAPTGPPVRIIESIAPVGVEVRPNGRIRLDFGQNITGKLRVTVTGPRGHTIGLHHAEVLENDELATRPLRGAASIDRLTLAGGDHPFTWTPHFTFHGFRYAELENWPGEFLPEQAVALVMHSDMERTGTFTSSDPLLNKLHENVVWSMRDNFLDLPTDCPQRDERLGWTGDIQVFGPTAAYLFRSTGTLVSWMRDVAAEQKALGSVPNFVPWIECGFPQDPAAAWGDVAVMLPWTLYQRTGDIGVLRDQYESMTAWVDQVDALTGHSGLWNSGFQLGDWLDPTAPPEKPDDSRTDRYLVASAYHARSARLLAQTAELLGNTGDAAKYSAVADRAASSFRYEFVTPSGRVVSDTETALSVAIMFELLANEDQVQRAGARLSELVIDSGYRIRTGFVGTPIICDALARVGAHDVAYHLLLQTQTPSWLYPITMGATTIWERWDSMLPDGSINPGEMTSFNHYSLGAVADYLHRIIGGLAPAAPGYREVLVAPVPGGGLRAASSELVSPYGLVRTGWTREGTKLVVRAEIPSGVTARVELPDGSDPIDIAAGSHEFVCSYRPAEDDPAAVQRVNLHNPEERALLETA
ncbi:alpha-L-rhamnosidase [Glaciihabitans tibetensis]|uniref:alpha-L-rhamnosidase n=1 Tax=Glaciihabitans tibetensis TaxID=1266600 RepID=A0A2T0V5I1_9MICO|nr:alpha-L-rhamnosidase [Glaciihabitans tibetensis]PRY65421.1 alpha-L-rhamnosidase [Glaciihabitans tibetensis]